ncbi:MAG TPA: STAS domain-containing protein [Acidimicrobiia bacterium]|jgi:anti-anti-sigma factor|nr:STAS domain-containing protein [Acidimicrobiia bacterium]
MDSAEDYLRVECEVSDDGRSVCLRLDGEFDMGTAPLVEDALSPALDPRCARLVVNLADVSFMDSSGLRVLVVARNALDERAEMVIADINDQLRRLFEISGLTSAFTFEP